jgi:protease-4
MYNHLLSAIGEARGLEPDEVRARLDQGPFLAREAKEQDLLDELAFEDEMYESLRAELAQEETRKVSHRMYRKYMEGAPAAGGRRIALVVGSGSIHGGSGSDGFGEENAIFSQTFARTLRRVRKDGSVDGVILRIDSPGGDAIASDEILHEVRLLSEEKPMVISMSDVAASGGYYIAMTGDPVVAYPNTVTGSIGVIYGKVNLRGFYDKIGVKKEILKRGRYADLDSDYQELTEDGRRKLRAGIDAVYRNFLKIVAEGRGRQPNEIEPLAEGRVWLGAQARRNGLVDELGGLNRAIDLLREEAGIGPDEGIQLVPYPRQRNLLEYLLEQDADSLLRGNLRELTGGLSVGPLLDGGILLLMPYHVEFR